MIPLRSRESRPLEQQVADSLRSLLEAGAFQPGEDLPSPLELACGMAVNPSAVRRAYQLLSGEGLLETQGEEVYRVVMAVRPDVCQTLLKTWDETTLALLARNVSKKDLEKRLREVTAS